MKNTVACAACASYSGVNGSRFKGGGYSDDRKLICRSILRLRKQFHIRIYT